jgi:hypothetical protein
MALQQIFIPTHGENRTRSNGNPTEHNDDAGVGS